MLLTSLTTSGIPLMTLQNRLAFKANHSHSHSRTNSESLTDSFRGWHSYQAGVFPQVLTLHETPISNGSVYKRMIQYPSVTV
jgi:hypothetical protein